MRLDFMMERNVTTIEEILGNTYFTDIRDVTGKENREEALEYLLGLEREQFQNKINNLSKKSKIRMLTGMGERGPDIIIEELFDEEESRKLLRLDLGAKIDTIADKINFKDCYYYYSHFAHYKNGVYFYGIPLQEDQLRTDLEEEFSSALDEMNNAEMKKHFRKALNSPYGVPLLGSKILMNEPTPHIIKLEDDKHIYFEFWMASKEERFIDLTQGDFVIIRTPIRIFCRLCLESSFLQLWSSPTSKEGIERAAFFVHNIFNLEFENKEYDINQNHMKKLEGMAKSLTHQSREGSGKSSNVSLTSSVHEGDTRTDPVVPNINRRNYREVNFLLPIPPLNNEVTVGVSAEKNYIRVFRQNISPKDKIIVLKYLKETLW